MNEATLLGVAYKICPACRVRSGADRRFCGSCGADIGLVEPTHGDPNLDVLIAGKYRLDSLIGEGAMGRVYRGQQVTLQKPFAVKILAPHLMHDEASHARFAAEAHNAASLNHPNCVSVVDYGRTEHGVTYIVMEYVQGRTLEDVIHEQFPLARERVVDLTLQILAALTEAHGLGILHRDLKPENILVQQLRTHGELAKVVDFGIAKLMDNAPGTARPGLTTQGMVCGTPEYMSPEQARGQKLDARSDLYAVGCILYQMLTGHPPFESSSAVEVLHRHLSEEPLAPSRVLGTDPDPLETVCLRALAKNPDDRYATAVEFREAVVAAGTTDSTASQTSACERCGADIRKSDKFCASCGAPVQGPSSFPRRQHPTRRSGSAVPLETDRERTAEIVVRSFPLPLVGRDGVLGRIRERLDRPHPGVKVLSICGPMGVGKTRLCDEIAALAEQLGWRTLYAGADPSGASLPLWPIKLMVSQLLGLDSQTATTRDLGRAANLSGLTFEELPGLAELFGMEGPAHPLEFQVRKRECYASAVRALAAGQSAKPTLLVFDDLDLFDATSRELLRRLTRTDATTPLMVVCTSAETDLDWLGGEVEFLGPLEDSAVREACRRGAVEVHPESTLADRVASGTALSPLRLELRLRLLALGVDAPSDLDERQLVRTRFDVLPAQVLGLIEIAAVLGERCQDSDLFTLAGLDGLPTEGFLDGVLADLHVGGILLVTGNNERTFSHRLIHEVAYRSMTEDRRRRLHTLAAEHGSIARHVTVRALHLLGGSGAGAIEALASAGTAAERLFDDRSAARYLSAALRRSDTMTDTAENRETKAHLVEHLGRVMRDKADAPHIIELVTKLLEQPHGPDALARLQLTLARHFARLERHGEAKTAYQRAVGPIIARGDRVTMLQIYAELAQVYVKEGSWQRGLDELREGLDLATLGEGPRADVDVSLWRYLMGVAETLRAGGRLQEALTWAGHALHQAERRRERLGLLRVHAQMARILRELDQRLLAEQHLARALEEARHFGDRLTTAELLIERARGRAAQGKITDARRCCEEALRLARAIEWSAGVRHAERALAMLEGR